MLKQRVITALVLIAFLLPALFAPVAWPFAVLSLAMIAAAGWEWGRLNGAGGFPVFDSAPCAWNRRFRPVRFRTFTGR